MVQNKSKAAFMQIGATAQIQMTRSWCNEKQTNIWDKTQLPGNFADSNRLITLG